MDLYTAENLVSSLLNYFPILLAILIFDLKALGTSSIFVSLFLFCLSLVRIPTQNLILHARDSKLSTGIVSRHFLTTVCFVSWAIAFSTTIALGFSFVLSLTISICLVAAILGEFGRSWLLYLSKFGLLFSLYAVRLVVLITLLAYSNFRNAVEIDLILVLWFLSMPLSLLFYLAALQDLRENLSGAKESRVSFLLFSSSGTIIASLASYLSSLLFLFVGQIEMRGVIQFALTIFLPCSFLLNSSMNREMGNHDWNKELFVSSRKPYINMALVCFLIAISLHVVFLEVELSPSILFLYVATLITQLLQFSVVHSSLSMIRLGKVSIIFKRKVTWASLFVSSSLLGAQANSYYIVGSMYLIVEFIFLIMLRKDLFWETRV